MMERISRRASYLGLIVLGCCSLVFAQGAPKTADEAANIDTYVSLLRQDVNSQKVAILSQIMQFTPEQAATFWPIYTEYSNELAKLGNEKLAGIKDFAANFNAMTDQKADEIATKALDLEGRRTMVKKTFYNKVKQALGGKNAARFLQVENQLLMIIDLQISSSLPVVE